VVLPGLLLMADYYFNPGFRFEGIRRNWKLYVLIAVGAAFGAMAIATVLRHSPSAGFGLRDFKWYQYLFTQFRVTWEYFGLFFAPVNQTLDYDFPISHTPLERGAILYGLGLLGLAVAAWVYRRKLPLASFGFFGYLLLLAPTSSILPIRDVMVEHRLYLPFICLLLIIVDVLRGWEASPKKMGLTLTAVVVVLSVFTYQRNELWASAIGIWKDATVKSPRKVRPRFQLAFAYYEAGRCNEAVREYDAASKLDPSDTSLLVDWALAEDCAHRPDRAIEKLKQAARLQPSAHVFSQIGMEYGKQDKAPEALQALDQAEMMDSSYMMTYVYKGHVYTKSGDYAKAAAQYQKALTIDPASQIARRGLADAQKKLQTNK
jgi:tetratricopeptide (TPR) repeat protein